jgi:zinc protease
VTLFLTRCAGRRSLGVRAARKDKHWYYGARTAIPDARGQRLFYAMAPVQTDKTSESMAEIERELDLVVDEHPPTAAELETMKKQNILTLSGRWETGRAILQGLGEIVQFDLPEDHWNRYPAVSTTAAATLARTSLVDREVLETLVEALRAEGSP